MTAPVNAQSISGAEMDNVKILQDNLRILGYFPANVESTGYYGKLTTDAVRKWKSAHNIYRTPATDFDSYCVELINKEV
jgi:peptidoglycan hydrolase-like protein with peptidoglycan-binding domain